MQRVSTFITKNKLTLFTSVRFCKMHWGCTEVVSLQAGILPIEGSLYLRYSIYNKIMNPMNFFCASEEYFSLPWIFSPQSGESGCSEGLKSSDKGVNSPRKSEENNNNNNNNRDSSNGKVWHSSWATQTLFRSCCSYTFSMKIINRRQSGRNCVCLQWRINQKKSGVQMQNQIHIISQSHFPSIAKISRQSDQSSLSNAHRQTGFWGTIWKVN